MESIPLLDYPRPQLKRNSYRSLNGYWDFALTEENVPEPIVYPDRICVPFPPESQASGLHMPILPRQIMHYRRFFDLESEFLLDHTVLHFGAVDQTCEVILNGIHLADHSGGYLPFSVDITDSLVIGRNELVLRVRDPLDHDLPWGKQTYQRGGMWYTPVSGIWQSVWMESFTKDAIQDLAISVTLDSVTLSVQTSADSYRLWIPEISYDSIHKEKQITIPIPNPHCWSTEDPHLYRFFIETEGDHVESYFALRTVSVREDDQGYRRICLNDKPIFLHGLLDQGYYAEGIYTPRDEEEMKLDILRAKQMGFNLLRKHIKVEPLRFYYLCDLLGMLVMQDFVNTGNYSFLRDTALPTIGMTRLPDCLLTRRKRARAFFLQNASGTQKLLLNSPCVIAYTIFNEGWGQFSADRVYSVLKSLDPSRLYDATSGWFSQKESDLDSRHIYFRRLKMKAGKRPLFLSEFGGYAYHDPQHSFSAKVYGYSIMKTNQELENAIVRLYEEQVIPLIPRGLCGTVYTQITDVEDETNGLITYDRQCVKVNIERMKTLSEKLKI